MREKPRTKKTRASWSRGKGKGYASRSHKGKKAKKKAIKHITDLA